MSLDIPNTWLALSLGDVIDYGKTEKIEPDEIPDDYWVLELEDIEKDTSRLLQKRTYAERRSKSTKNRFKKGDVLYGKLRPYLNKVVIADQDGCCTTEIIPLKSTGAFDNRYLFYWLKHPAFLNYVADVSHGINMPRLGTDAGRAAPFVLAPLNEQKRIADKLDTLLTAADTCRARLDKVPALIKRFRQAVLAAATTGELTEDWHTRNANPKWEKTPIQQLLLDKTIFDGPFGSSLKTLDYTDSGVRVIRLENIGHLNFIEDKYTYISQEKYEQLRRHTLAPDDIIFSSFVSEEVRACLFPKNQPWIAINKADCFCIRVDNKKCIPKYLVFRLACHMTYQAMSALVHGATRPRINLKQLKEFEIELPSIEEQREIVRRVEALFAIADKLEARLAAARARVDQLTPAILAQAFRGELVAQDQNDEPASALLARIAAADGLKRAPKRAIKKAA